MSRRRAAPKREILPDPKFHDQVVAKFINYVMQDGNKPAAEKIMYGALDIVAEKTKEDALQVFHNVLEKLRPEVEVRSRRVGGATYQVPTAVRPKRAMALAMRWLKDAARSRKGERTMVDKLAAEIMEASQDRGGAMKKFVETGKMAEANQAFAHFRW